MAKRKPWGIFVVTKNDEELTLWFIAKKDRDRAAAEFKQQDAKTIIKKHRSGHA